MTMTVLPADDYDASIDAIARSFVDGVVVPFLGAGVNLTDRPPDYQWEPTQSAFLPSGGELARHVAGIADYFGDDRCVARECLNHATRRPAACDVKAADVPCRADTCRIKAAGIDLARVTQFLMMAKRDQLELYLRLREVLEKAFEPTSAHLCIASLVARLKAHAPAKPAPLIVTTNYDDLMEQAFAGTNQPFDLIFYEAKRGQFQGRFFHREPGATASVVMDNSYNYQFFKRYPVILKIHGHLDRADRAGDSYVITEDDYIKYVANTVLEQVLPGTILSRLRNSRLLFLGYALRDWNLRVFLHRLAASQELATEHWAVARNFSDNERSMWKRQRDLPVEIIDSLLATFISRLNKAIDRLLPAEGRR
jgi:hypothetical protein